MYDLLGLCLVLAAFLVFNALASTGATALWFVVNKLKLGLSASTRARLLFILRISPAAASSVWALAFMMPAYLLYEPEHSTEMVSIKLAVLAVASALGIGLAIRRGIGSWLATRRLVTEWLSNSEAIPLEGLAVAAYRIDHPFPLMAIVGTFRPRLFVAGQVLDSLTKDEIRAALIHEGGHLAARDNFKRVIIRACRDVLSIVPSGRSLDRAWIAESEAAADDHAALGGLPVALDLAGALVKIARMVPQGMTSLPTGTFLGGENVGEIAWRVRRLTGSASGRLQSPGKHRLWPAAAGWCFAFSLTSLLCFASFNLSTLAKIHTATEYIVSSLS